MIVMERLSIVLVAVLFMASCGGGYLPTDAGFDAEEPAAGDDGGADELDQVDDPALYPDCDGDGWGVAIADCDGHTWATQLGDCDDGDNRARPDQDFFQETPTPSGSWDFDCSGDVTLKYTELVDCSGRLEGECRKQEGELGWLDESVPDCGEGGSWTSGCWWYEGECVTVANVWKVQSCR